MNAIDTSGYGKNEQEEEEEEGRGEVRRRIIVALTYFNITDKEG